MKYHETQYEEYLEAAQKYDIHPEIAIPRIGAFAQFGNLILYGPSGVGKYTQMLRFLKALSPSELKYDKRITMQTEKYTHTYRISDIHYEIDMAILGCNSKIIWHDIFQQIVDIISMKPQKTGILVCKNFHGIHTELLDIFYSYMQQYSHPQLAIQIKFVLLTEHISFIPNNILDSCRVVRVKRPEADIYQRMFTKEHLNVIDTRDILNLKEIYMCRLLKRGEAPPKEIFNTVCNKIIGDMSHMETMVISTFRDSIYDILVYNLDVADCVWYIFVHFIREGRLSRDAISEILEKTHLFLKYYNNNYRPIYHLENIFVFMINKLYHHSPNENNESNANNDNKTGDANLGSADKSSRSRKYKKTVSETNSHVSSR